MSAEFHVQELIPAYALGCLDEDDSALVAQHLAACPACQAELGSYQALVAQLALAAPEAVPSPDLHQRLLNRLQGASPVIQLPQSQPAWWQQLINLRPRLALAWGVISASLILLLLASNLLLWQQINQLQTNQAHTGMRAIPLTSTGIAPGGAGYIIIGADGQNGALVVDRLPVLDPQHQYQLWLIHNEQRTSGAVFSVDDYGYGGTRIKAPGSLFDYSACGVSIEPAGGSLNPTGERVLSGSLK